MPCPNKPIYSIYLLADRKVIVLPSYEQQPRLCNCIFAVSVLDNRSFGRIVSEVHALAKTVGYLPTLA